MKTYWFLIILPTLVLVSLGLYLAQLIEKYVYLGLLISFAFCTVLVLIELILEYRSITAELEFQRELMELQRKRLMDEIRRTWR